MHDAHRSHGGCRERAPVVVALDMPVDRQVDRHAVEHEQRIRRVVGREPAQDHVRGEARTLTLFVHLDARRAPHHVPGIGCLGTAQRRRVDVDGRHRRRRLANRGRRDDEGIERLHLGAVGTHLRRQRKGTRECANRRDDDQPTARHVTSPGTDDSAMRADAHHRWARTTGTSWSGGNAAGRTDGEGEEMLRHRREAIGAGRNGRSP